MFGRLMPFEGRFFELFVDLADQTVLASKELLALMSNFDDLERRAFNIETLEKKGDKITYNTIETLRKTFITPIEIGRAHV